MECGNVSSACRIAVAPSPWFHSLIAKVPVPTDPGAKTFPQKIAYVYL